MIDDLREAVRQWMPRVRQGEFATAFPDSAILITSAGADPDSRPHSTDESLPLEDFERACLAEALLLEELAQRYPATDHHQDHGPARSSEAAT